jgi:hypothetical protein
MAGLYKLWEVVVYSHTEEDFEAAWEKLQAYFHSQTAIIRYLKETWMLVKEQWAGCYINQNLNFGQRSTSPVESINRYLKSFLITGRSSVLECVKRSLEMVAVMKSNIDEALKAEKNRLRFDFLGKDWLGDAPYNVSSKALNHVIKQHRLMLGALPTRGQPPPSPLVDCTHRTRAQYGIPCSHELLERHHQKSPLTKDDFHRFWWLKRNLAEEDEMLRYQEFDVVVNLKGRPRGSDAFASNPNAPRLTAPPPRDRESEEVVIPCSQPPSTARSREPSPSPSTQGTIVVASEPVAPKKAPTKAPTKKRATKKQSTGRQSGLMPSIRRAPSSWEGVVLEGSQTTVSIVSTPSLTPNAVSGTPTALRTPSSTAMATAAAPVGITKRGGTQRTTRSRAKK